MQRSRLQNEKGVFMELEEVIGQLEETVTKMENEKLTLEEA